MVERVEGLDIYYETVGSGSPVLLLHGWGGSTQTMAPIANRLVPDFCVTSIDFPGHGQSSTPDTPMDAGDFARVTRKFMAQTGISGCDVLGHSHGGRTIIKLASTDIQAFGKIILVDAAGIKPKRTFSYYRKVYTYKLMKRLAKLPAFKKMLAQKMANAGSEEYRVLSQSMRATFSKLVNEDLTKSLSRIKNPTLLIWGTADTDTPLWMGEQMEKLIPDSGLVKLEGAGHYSYLDQYDNFIVIIRHFLGGGN